MTSIDELPKTPAWDAYEIRLKAWLLKKMERELKSYMGIDG